MMNGCVEIGRGEYVLWMRKRCVEIGRGDYVIWMRNHCRQPKAFTIFAVITGLTRNLMT